MYYLSNAWKSKKKRPIEFQFLFLQKEINIYYVYIKNQRVGAATKSSIWILIECSDFQKITLWIFVCWGVTFFFISVYKVWIMRVKIMKKNRKLDKKIISICEIFRFNCWWILFHTRVEILLIYDKTIGTIKQFAQN